MPVVGIGGVFFRAKDPDALHAWYREHLGVMFPDYQPWIQAAGETMLTPFEHDTQYFPPDKQWMINFRVNAIDDLLSTLRAAGISVETREEWDSMGLGRFARIQDPEGNQIELWEPAEA